MTYQDLIRDSRRFKESKLGAALARLREQGIRACMNIGQTPEEGEELITDYGDSEGEYVFYTGEEHSSFINSGNGALWFGSSALADCDEESFDDKSSKIGRKICEILAVEGIEANLIQPCKLTVCLDYSYKDYLSFIELILADRDEVDWNEQLVMMVIADYIQDGPDEELSDYEELDEEDRAHIIWQFNVWLHSGIEEFTDYFKGYYSTPDNGFHDEYVDDGSTSLDLYEFLDTLDWSRIYSICRRYFNQDTISTRFFDATGFDYIEERAKYPVEAWDGTPRWKTVNGIYVASD
jgi:hypothetical protein